MIVFIRNMKTTKFQTSAHLVGDLQGLGLLGSLGLLESRLQTGLDILGERSGGSDGDGKLSLVSSNQLVEALNNTLCL